MSDIGDAISAVLILIVGGGVIAIMAGADASIVSGLMTSGVTLVVYVAVFAFLALTLISIVNEF